MFVRSIRQDSKLNDAHTTFESPNLEFDDAYQRALDHVSQG